MSSPDELEAAMQQHPSSSRGPVDAITVFKSAPDEYIDSEFAAIVENIEHPGFDYDIAVGLADKHNSFSKERVIVVGSAVAFLAIAGVAAFSVVRRHTF